MAHDKDRQRNRAQGALMLAGAPIAAAIGSAFATYVFDPEMGRTRRARVRNRAVGARNRAFRRSRKGARYMRSQAAGMFKRLGAAVMPHADDADDVTLAHRVESVILRDRQIPKGRLTIGAEGGAIVLRGAVPLASEIREIEEAVRHVHGVKEVRNLLHLEGTMAPNKAEALLHERAPSFSIVDRNGR